MAGAELQTLPYMTVAEFMDWDGGGHVGKLELVNGEVRAMSPASGVHSTIQANLAYLIGAHLRGRGMPCRVGMEAPVIPRIHANDNVRAPDSAVACDASQSEKTFQNPILIIEILSPSNKRETWESIYAMATISTLTEIAVVESEKVEVFRREPDGGWPKSGVTFVAGEDVQFASIGASFPIAEIYAGTVLA